MTVFFRLHFFVSHFDQRLIGNKLSCHEKTHWSVTLKIDFSFYLVENQSTTKRLHKIVKWCKPNRLNKKRNVWRINWEKGMFEFILMICSIRFEPILWLQSCWPYYHFQFDFDDPIQHSPFRFLSILSVCVSDIRLFLVLP